VADVQPENGYTKIADEILEQMARIKLSPTQYRILFIVWRYTYGFNRKEHELTLGFLSNATGCEKRQLQRELKGLEDRKIIFQKIQNGIGRRIKFNKNHDDWVGKTAIGEITIGETDNGEIVNGTIGETDNATIGEIDNQEIHYLKTDLKTEEEEEVGGQLSESEIMRLAHEVEKHYCTKRGIRDSSPTDFQEMKLLVSHKIPIEFIKSSIDTSFNEYRPKYPTDKIRTFSYCSVAVYENWSRYTEKIKPFPKGGQTNAKFQGINRGIQYGRDTSKSASLSIPDEELDELISNK
jgi:phage replication O-like protein O